MPTELRRLIFSNEELIAAIARYSKVAAEKLPAGEITSCQVSQEGGVVVNLTILDAAQDKKYEVALKTAFIGAALIKYCIELKIPMPKRSEKSIQALGDNIALNLTINAKENSLFTVNS